MKYPVILLIALFAISTPSFAQSKKETKEYNKAIVSENVKSLNKFLKKYPESIYIQQVGRKRDSLLFSYVLPDNGVIPYYELLEQYPNSYYASEIREEIAKMSVSSLTEQEARDIFQAYITEESLDVDEFVALGIKEKDKEYIVSVSKMKDEVDYFKIIKLRLEEGEWVRYAEWKQELYRQFDEYTDLKLNKGVFEVVVEDKRYLQFTYENSLPETEEVQPIAYIEYCISLIEVEQEVVFATMFSGIETVEDNIRSISGISVDLQNNLSYTVAPMEYLFTKMNTLNFLNHITPQEQQSDLAIEWWYENNEIPTKKVKFRVLSSESSLVREFNRQRANNVEQDEFYNASLFTHRGQNVLIIYQKSAKQYILLWSEPVVKNRSKEYHLNRVYFQNSNTLVLYFFEGRRAIKARLNINSGKFTSN